MKYFLGVLRGCWVLRFEWITASLDAGYWVDEVPYQIYDNEFGYNAPKLSRASHNRGDPPLFAGCEVQLLGTFNNPTKEQLELMIEAGGGMVVSQLFLWSKRSTATTHDHNDSTDNAIPTRHIILFDKANEGVRRMKMDIQSVKEVARSLEERVQVVHHKDFLDCITTYDIDALDSDDPSDDSAQ